jgi:hypothetical protein
VTDLLRICPQRAHDVPFPHPKYMLHSVSAVFEQQNRMATGQVAGTLDRRIADESSPEQTNQATRRCARNR